MKRFRDPNTVEPTRILAVAFNPADLSALPAHVCAPGASVVSVSIDSVRKFDLTGTDAPGFVISPLVSAVFDAQDLARLLSDCGFRGRYIAVANSVAEPNVIRSDVASVAPALDFELVELNGKAPLREV